MTRLERAAEVAGRALVRAPGLLAFACAVAGAWLLADVGVALVVAAVLLLLIDRQMP